ncbi:MAG: Rieske 2Fe-2S domain-containing protein [Burkholderiales bacterium]
MLSHEDNATLTGVCAGSALHKPLAKFWYPVLQSQQLANRHTRKIRLLGENFVLARDGDALIALEENCPHRRASLVLARVEDQGLRCIYHGWLMGRDGSVKETPNERDTGGRGKLRIRAPAAREAGGLIWINICQNEAERAPFPDFPWMHLPAEQVVIADVFNRVNWTQSLEGAIDSSHSSVLHSDQIISESNTKASIQVRDGAQFLVQRPSIDKHPRLRVRDTDFGFVYAALRTPIKDPETMIYARATAFAFPCFVNIPASTNKVDVQMFVPVDDVHTHFIFIRSSSSGPIDRAASLAWSGLEPGRDLDDEGYVRAAALPNWGQDREAMAAGRSFTGLRGTSIQDFAVQESMGPIVDRTRENLGAADAAIVHFRRQLLASAKGELAGDAAFVRAIRYEGFIARDGLLPKDQDWTELYKDGEINWKE